MTMLAGHVAFIADVDLKALQSRRNERGLQDFGDFIIQAYCH
jgi:hypothetical protein